MSVFYSSSIIPQNPSIPDQESPTLRPTIPSFSIAKKKKVIYELQHHHLRLVILFLQRQRHAHHEGRLVDAMMLVAQDAHATGLQHHRQRELHGVAEPALGEGAQQMAVGHQHDIGGRLAVHIRRLARADLGDERVQALRHLGRHLALLTAVAPDVPGLVGVEALCLAARADLLCEEPFVRAVVPLGQGVGDGDAVEVAQVGLRVGGEEQLEGALGAGAGRDVDVGEGRGVDELEGADELAAGAEDLAFAAWGEGEVRLARVAAVDCPFGFAW